jgi:hypothetical protein
VRNVGENIGENADISELLKAPPINWESRADVPGQLLTLGLRITISLATKDGSNCVPSKNQYRSIRSLHGTCR